MGSMIRIRSAEPGRCQLDGRPAESTRFRTQLATPLEIARGGIQPTELMDHYLIYFIDLPMASGLCRAV